MIATGNPTAAVITVICHGAKCLHNVSLKVPTNSSCAWSADLWDGQRMLIGVLSNYDALFVSTVLPAIEIPPLLRRALLAHDPGHQI